ncbi:MAG TPA: transketolase C-terminal domain-containing protein, partial [Kofleriaceae bacterium]
LLAAYADAEPRLVVLDGDLADSDGAHHFAVRHPDRFVMAGIAEQSMVSVAAGMAEAGRRPWVFSFAAFLCYRAYDQIRVCLSQARQPVVLVGSHAGGLSGRNGKSHAAVNDLALMLSLPGMQVWSPADRDDTRLAVRTLLATQDPSYLRCPRTPIEDDLPGEARPMRWLTPRAPVVIVSTGIASHWALAAARLVGAGQVGVLHVARLRPLPDLAGELREARRVFVVEDHATFGGLASLVHRLGLRLPITALGWPDDYAGQSGGDDQLRAAHGLSAEQLARTIARDEE